MTEPWESLIKQVPFFASMPPDEISNLAKTLHPFECPEGELLMKEGEHGERFYILLEGEMEIIKSLGTPEERLIAIRGAGSFIGEMSLMNIDGLRTASVRAQSKSSLLEMTRADFNELLQRNPVLAYEMVRVLSMRLKESETTTIQELREKNIQLTKAYQELEAAQEQIVEKERLERELEVARDIQLGILPRSLPKHPGAVFDASIQPTSAVGGDFFDVFPKGDQVMGIAVGDVSDHGVPAALFMALTVTLLRAEAKRTDSMCDIMFNVNRQLIDLNETNMFVTILYGEINFSTRKFRYVRAGHELPMLMDAKGEFIQLEHGPGMPLGLFEYPDLDEQTISLGENDTLLLFTDGATDAQNKHGEQFGKDRLRDALRKIRQSNVEDTCQMLMSDIQSHCGSVPQYDDITLLSYHHHGKL